MDKDPVLEELPRVRQEHAARFHYDLRAMYRDLKAREERGGVVVRRSPHPPRVKVALKKRTTERGAA